MNEENHLVEQAVSDKESNFPYLYSIKTRSAKTYKCLLLERDKAKSWNCIQNIRSAEYETREVEDEITGKVKNVNYLVKVFAIGIRGCADCEIFLRKRGRY